MRDNLYLPHVTTTAISRVKQCTVSQSTESEPYDFGAPDNQEWFVDDIISHRWTGLKELEYQVHWSLGNTTWK